MSGSKRYATTVAVEGGEITSNCTCPYELTCKHAVAVVLEYLDRLKNSKPIPTSPGADERLEMIASDSNADDEELWGETLKTKTICADPERTGMRLRGS